MNQYNGRNQFNEPVGNDQNNEGDQNEEQAVQGTFTRDIASIVISNRLGETLLSSHLRQNSAIANLVTQT